MRRVRISSFLLGITMLVVGCSTHSQLKEPAPADPRVDEVKIFVGSFDGPMLSLAPISKVTSEGIEKIGFTDPVGVIKLDASRIRNEQWLLILACYEYHYCGAIVLEGKPLKKEYQIWLSRIVL